MQSASAARRAIEVPTGATISLAKARLAAIGSERHPSRRTVTNPSGGIVQSNEIIVGPDDIGGAFRGSPGIDRLRQVATVEIHGSVRATSRQSAQRAKRGLSGPPANGRGAVKSATIKPTINVGTGAAGQPI